jgi:hypothetical protein
MLKRNLLVDFVIYLSTSKTRKKTQDESEAYCPPADYWRIGSPKVDAFDLLSTIGTKSRAMFDYGPVGCSLAAETIQWLIFGRDERAMCEFYSLGGE